MDSVEHGKNVLGRVLASRGSADTADLDYAVARLLPAEHFFTDRVQAALFELCRRYADNYRAVLPKKVLDDVLRDKPPGTALLYGEYYDALCEREVADDEFRHSVDQLRDLAAERVTGEALAQGITILQSGARDERTGEVLHGHAAAREHVLAAFAAAERDATGTDTPDGDIRAEREKILGQYARAKELRLSGRAPGVQFGISGLDDKLKSGVAPGSLNIVLGWTSAGKTSYCVQWAWHVSVVQQRDVVYFTTETLRPGIVAKLIARHSRLAKFGLPKGLNSDDILGGTLDPEEEDSLNQVVADLTSGPYGRIQVTQCGKAAGVSVIESRLAANRRQFTPAIAFVDYAQLLVPERNGYRDAKYNVDLAGIVKDLKQVGAAFGEGAGIPVVTPWQVSREGRRNLKPGEGYTLLDVAETKEAADTADLVLALVDPGKDTTRGRAVPVEAMVLKNRLGERNFGVQLTADFATSFFDPRTTSETSFLDIGG